MTSVTAVAAPLPAGASDPGLLLDRADLIYCLARAFMPPSEQGSVCDWAQPLAADLAELGSSIGLPTAAAQAALEAECERWAQTARLADGKADAWLVEYSRLFLMPPVRVPLNTGMYLQGSIGGTAAQMMRSCYETAGTAPNDGFHDLPDHVAMQLEFVARLLERAARGDADGLSMAEEFSHEFIHAWAEPLQRACDAAAAQHPAARVYSALAHLLRHAVGEPGMSAA